MVRFGNDVIFVFSISENAFISRFTKFFGIQYSRYRQSKRMKNGATVEMIMIFVFNP